MIFLDQLTAKRLNGLITEPRAGQKQGWLQAYHTYRDQSNTAHEAALEMAVAQWNQFIEQFLHEIWDSLMGPVASWLEARNIPRGSEIILMSPGLLSVLPLQAAKSRDVESRYFIEDWVVSTITSPRALIAVSSRLSSQEAQGKTLLAVTDPLGDIGETVNPAWPCFSETGRRNITSAANQFIEELRASHNWSYISFFGHGLWDVSQPENSHLVMSDGSMVTAEDIGNTDLTSTRMVVLGACETGLIGTQDTPDEFIGLPSALIQSGVSGVAASLWLVDAASTYDLLQRFMKLHCDGISPAAALRKAQLTFIAGEMDDASSTSATSYHLSRLKTLRPLGPSKTHNEKRVVITLGKPKDTKPSEQQIELKRAMPFFWAAFVLIGR